MTMTGEPQDWLSSLDEDDPKGSKYEWMMSKEPRDDFGPIEEIDDKWLGKTKVRRARFGMTRNAKDENKTEALVYLQPIPHIRIEKAKPLQGWYKSLHEPAGVRPRPCFSESILTQPVGGWCAVGCVFSLPAGELIDTPLGPKPIESILDGDMVFGRTNDSVVETRVFATTRHWKEEGLVVVTTSDGRTLRMTADHPVYSVSRGWVNAGSLSIGEELVDVRSDEKVLLDVWATITNSVGKSNTTVAEIENTPGRVEVFDIQTGTANFFQRGILVHNCYIDSGFRGYRGSGLATVPLHYGSQIRDQLSKMRRAAAGYFSSFTDPFLPLEDYYHNTQEASLAFVEVGLPVFYLSRLKYPDWAIDILTRSQYSYAQKSLNKGNPEDYRLLSPGALSLEEHYDDIARIKKRGIYVSIQVNPIIPGVTDHKDVYRLFRDLAKCGADHVIVKFVEAGYSWASTMVARMVKRFGERGEKFAKLFVDNQGGQRCVEESYRLNAHKLYRNWATELGMTYATCYEYRYERNPDGSIVNKTGISIGREYTTSAQCHGMAEPVFVRNSERDQFRPLDECPPSGCLYCASENEGKPRCGDDLMGEANALVSSDYKIPIGRGAARNPANPLLQLGVIDRGVIR